MELRGLADLQNRLIFFLFFFVTRSMSDFGLGKFERRVSHILKEEESGAFWAIERNKLNTYLFSHRIGRL